MIGDSITCGYGVLGAGPGCGFTADTEAETHAWGALAAAQLGAWNTAIAYSGKGVIRNYGGDTIDLMPALFLRQDANDPASTWNWSYQPQVVVVNLGTNDYSVGDPGQAFEDAYIAFVATIRGKYPDAWIVVSSSPMLDGADHSSLVGHLQAVVAASGARVRFLDLLPQDPADGYGCDWHPSEATQRKMAAALVAEIREVTGW